MNRISYTGEFTYRMKPHYSEFNIMNSQDQMAVYQEMQQKDGLLTPIWLMPVKAVYTGKCIRKYLIVHC